MGSPPLQTPAVVWGGAAAGRLGAFFVAANSFAGLASGSLATCRIAEIVEPGLAPGGVEEGGDIDGVHAALSVMPRRILTVETALVKRGAPRAARRRCVQG